TLDDFRQTRVYQESLQEGIEQGLAQGLQQGLQQGRHREALSLVLRLVNRKFGNLASDRIFELESLTVEQLEELAESLLDINTLDSFYQYLEHLSQK
ncbi:MAG: DUF4351 domain-containing protein, partial [Pseudanabaenaceae cyanobacterium]